jgi:hypothetical protein
VPSTAEYAINPLTAPGTYTITAGRTDGSEQTSVQVTVPAPPVPNSADIVAPADNAFVLSGWSGPIRVRWDSISDPEATYVVRIESTDVCSFVGSDLSPGAITSCTLPSAPGLGTWSIFVVAIGSGGEEIIDVSSVNVEPHLARPGVSISPARFYPYVRDGFRDRARIAFSLNKQAYTTITIRTLRGRTVRRVVLGWVNSSSWSWNGRNARGARVAVGRYRVTVSVRARGETKKRMREVVVARGWRTRNVSKSFCGACGPGIVATAPGCFVTANYSRDGDVLLDCWGGEYAIVTWRFRVHPRAFNIRKSISGQVGCCAPGEVASAGERNGPRTYTVAAGVSDWRSWNIFSVRIRYSYRVRI